MLHGVAGEHPESSWHPLWTRLPAETFDEVLGQLGRYYNFVSLDEAVAIIAGERPVVDNALVLTFDDGYRNNFMEALPILTRHGASATFFMATGYVGTGKVYWIDRLDYALQNAPDSARYIEEGQYRFDLRNRSRAGLISGYRDLRLAIKDSCRDEHQMLEIFGSIASKLERAAGTSIDEIIGSDPYASVATWDDLRSALQDGAGIGSHTVDHFRLDKIDEGEVDGQLTLSRAEIEGRLGIGCTLFCYPNGNHNEFIRSRTREAGYGAAVTTEVGTNAVGDDLFTLKRMTFPAKGSMIENLIAVSGLKDMRLIRRVMDACS